MTSGEVGMVSRVESRVLVMGKLGIFQCNVILSVDGNMQYDSAFFGHSFFGGLDSSVGNKLREYRLEETVSRKEGRYKADRKKTRILLLEAPNMASFS